MAIDTYGVRLDTAQATRSLKELTTLTKGFIGVLAGQELLKFGQEILNSTRQYENLTNKLRLVTQGTADLQRITAELQKTAVASRTSFADTVDLFSKLRVTTDALGISESRVIEVTSKLSQALQVAGADGNTASAVIRQFGQAMASGEVRGDEFRSIVEGLGPALAIMARESGLTVGQLRAMSQSGKLTAEVMFTMLENSKSLTVAFQEMKPTIDNLETVLSDAFSLALTNLGALSGFTQGYTRTLGELTEAFSRFNDSVQGTQTSLSNKSNVQLFKEIESGQISASESLKYFEKRYKDLQVLLSTPLNLLPLTDSNQEAQRIQEILPALRELTRVREADAAATKEQQAALAANNAELSKILGPYKAYIDEAVKYEKMEFGTAIEKASVKFNKASETLDKLREAQAKVNDSGFNVDGVKDFSEEITNAEKAVADLGRELENLSGRQSYSDFITELNIESTRLLNTEENLRRAIIETSAAFEASGGTSKQYLVTLAALYDQQEKFTNFRAINDSVDRFAEDLLQGLEQSQQAINQLSMSPFERELDTIKNKIQRDVTDQILALEKLRTPQNTGALNSQIQSIISGSKQVIEQQQMLARQARAQSRSFGQGWKEAFEEYSDAATNSAELAQRVFQKSTQGMEDLIVNFAKTGKFEWKNFVSSMLEELLRSQIQIIFAQLLGNIGTSVKDASGNIIPGITDPSGAGGAGAGGAGGSVGGVLGSGAAGIGLTPSNPVYVFDVSGGMGGGAGGADSLLSKLSVGSSGANFNTARSAADFPDGTSKSIQYLTQSLLGGGVKQGSSSFGSSGGSGRSGRSGGESSFDDLLGIFAGESGGGSGKGSGKGSGGGFWSGVSDFFSGAAGSGGGSGGSSGGFSARDDSLSSLINGFGNDVNTGRFAGGTGLQGNKFYQESAPGVDIRFPLDQFAGAFAKGGTLGAGKWGIAGEAGPEIISGPATITPMSAGGSTQVTYNINAVDARSFKELLAQDPSYLYGLTMQGAKGVPARR